MIDSYMLKIIFLLSVLQEVAALREQSMKLQRQIEKTSLSSRGKENAQAKTPLKVRQVSLSLCNGISQVIF